jgi:hypothetical protein
MKDITLCVHDDCAQTRTNIFWCDQHFGFFRHDCITPGCDSKVLYDDEPWCFVHSPDAGSSKPGYSAYLAYRDQLDPYVSDSPESYTF